MPFIRTSSVFGTFFLFSIFSSYRHAADIETVQYSPSPGLSDYFSFVKTMSSCTLFRVYRLLFPNGKAYIGQTSSLPIVRFKQHATVNSGSVVGRAIQKYGKDAVKIETLVVTGAHEIDDAERIFIAAYDTLTHTRGGYNVAPGGKGKTAATSRDIEVSRLVHHAFWGDREAAEEFDETFMRLVRRLRRHAIHDARATTPPPPSSPSPSSPSSPSPSPSSRRSKR